MAAAKKSGKDRRGGNNRRRHPKKEGLGDIDRQAIFDLLKQLDPKGTDDHRAFALEIVVKGIEVFREHAPSKPALAGSGSDQQRRALQNNRRALAMFQKGNTASGHPPFNGFACVGGRLYGTTSKGLYKIEDVPRATEGSYGALEDAVANPLRDLSALRQLAAGFKHIYLQLPFNGHLGVGEDGQERTVGDVLLDEYADPPDREAELAGFVYLAIAKGLGKEVSTTQPKHPPKRTGFKYWRLLKLALEQAGVPLSAGEAHGNLVRLERLMGAGKEAAEIMLAPAITHADGRTFSDFEMRFLEK